MLLHALPLCLIAAPTAAQAPPGVSRTSVVVIRAPAKAPALRSELESAWRGRGHELTSPPPAPVLHRPDPALLATGRRSFSELRPREAVLALEDYVAQVDAAAGGATRREWLEALLLMARARLALGDGARATEAFDRVLAVDPSLELDPAGYPPPFREAFDALRAQRRLRPALSLVVNDAPAGLTVAVDGAQPVPVTDLPQFAPGLHLLRLMAPGYLPRALRLELDHAHHDFSARLEVDPFAPLRAETPVAYASQELRAAAARLGAVPLVAQVEPASRGRVRVTLWDAGTDQRVAIRVAQGTSPARLVRGLFAALDSLDAAPDRPRHRRILGWSIGVSLAVVAGVALAFTLTRRSQPGFQLDLEPGSVMP